MDKVREILIRDFVPMKSMKSLINDPKPKPKTPKQIAKALGDTYPKELDKFAYCPDKGLILVPETDKRQAHQGAVEDFANDPEE